jgi:hypothetical protein
MSHRARIGVTFVAVAVLLGSSMITRPSAGEAAAPESPGPSCRALAGRRIPASVMSLPTRGGRIESAEVVSETVSGAISTYCRVGAALFPVDPSAPDIEMRVAMPIEWNRRSMMFGGGGVQRNRS